jgi:hypothetical protein
VKFKVAADQSESHIIRKVIHKIRHREQPLPARRAPQQFGSD